MNLSALKVIRSLPCCVFCFHSAQAALALLACSAAGGVRVSTTTKKSFISLSSTSSNVVIKY